MNCITIEFCAEDRARIDRLVAALERQCSACAEGIAPLLGLKAEAPDPVQQKLADVVAQISDPIKAEPETAPVEVAPPPAPVVSLAEFQKALTLKCAESEETKAKVRALLHEYAEAASKVPEDKRAEVLDRLAKL